MKWLKRWGPAMGMVFLCGCFEVKDELTVQPDGSGTVRLEVTSKLPAEYASMAGMSGRGGVQGIQYPPTSATEARHFFPAKDFTVKITEKPGAEGSALLIEASFKDVNALLSSPYARAHQLTLVKEAASLKLRALTGCEPAARMVEIKPDEGMDLLGEVPGMEDAEKTKKEMKFSFRVTLPNAIESSNGAKEGISVTWSADRAKSKDDAEFLTSASLILEAACPAQGIAFTPATPPRLALQPFGQLAPGKFSSGPALPDTNKIAATARFVPVRLHVTRAVDLSGESFGRESMAQLTGVLTMPSEFAPSRWGESRLEEVLDAKGENLLPKEDDENMSVRFAGRNGRIMTTGDESDDEEAGAADKTAGQAQHMLTFSFNAPPWKVKELKRIKGFVEIQYLGGSEVIKLTNAVPANLIRDMSKIIGSGFDFDSERAAINHPRLAEMGLGVKVQMAMAQSGMTTISLETTGKKSGITEIQVFDADGHPWPSSFMNEESGGEASQSCQVVVMGKPKAPLSMALVVGDVGASLKLPVLMENVPVSNKPKTAKALKE